MSIRRVGFRVISASAIAALLVVAGLSIFGFVLTPGPHQSTITFSPVLTSSKYPIEFPKATNQTSQNSQAQTVQPQQVFLHLI